MFLQLHFGISRFVMDFFIKSTQIPKKIIIHPTKCVDSWGLGTRISRWILRGCATLMGRFFHKKSLNMVPFSIKISVGLFFPKFLGVCRHPKIVKKWAYSRKIPKNGYLFLPKWPLKIGRGFEVQVVHRPSKPNLSPPTHSSLSVKVFSSGFASNYTLCRMWNQSKQFVSQ